MLYGRTQTRVVPRVFTREELARIEAPTLLVLGERERIYRPDKAGRAARRLMPSVQVELIPRAHHVTAIANPEAVNACVTAFLGEHMTPVSSPRRLSRMGLRQPGRWATRVPQRFPARRAIHGRLRGGSG